MSNDVRRLAYLLKNDVEGVEFGNDAQLAQVARFVATLCDARIAAKTPADLGHDAIVCAAEVFSLQIASREKLIELHRRLGDVAGRVGVTELASGGSYKPGPGAALLTAEAEGRSEVSHAGAPPV